MKTMVSTAGGGLQPPPIVVPDELQPGAKAGPWIVERELGRGGMGAVYAVVHEEIGKRAALKVVHGRLLTPGFNSDRMLLEAKVVNQVGHPNIVDIFETGKLDDGRPYIVMERLEGQPLSYRADDGKILPDQVISILLQVCDALIAAHAAGVVHRDLKLDNIFLVDNPDEPSMPKIKLLDWGIAKVINHDVKHTVEGQLVGTPQYLAPEQARGAAVSPQTDVYSLGVMAYELFLEQLPFEAETSAEIMAMHLRATPPPPSELWPDIPPQLEDLLLAMLAKAPDKRPTTLEVARRLEAIRDELARRCHAAAEQPPRHTVVPLTAAKSMRVSRAGLAPTEPAQSAEWPLQNKRWQYVVGGLAIAASAALFVLTRAGDSNTASAATTDAAEAREQLAVEPEALATPEAPEAAPDEVTSDVAAAAPVTPPNLIDSIPASDAEIVPAVHEPPAVRTTSRSAHRHRVSHGRKAPVAPRRAAVKIDPDGTIDPYQ